jgi:hypothetical protein
MTKRQLNFAKKTFAILAILMMIFATLAGAVASLLGA